MPNKTILFIRHAQALHNVDESYKQHRDPGLTPEGESQALRLKEHLKMQLANRKVDCILVSPMRRALSTAEIALDWLYVDRQVPVRVDALWQEVYDKPCDTGSEARCIKAEFPLPAFDFGGLDPVYPDKTSPRARRYHADRESVLARGREAVRELAGMPGSGLVIVVSHGGFLRTAVAGRWFGNADYRVFDLVEKGEDWFVLVEQPGRETGGMGMSREGSVELGTGLH